MRVGVCGIERAAGYEILAQQTNPATSYLRAAREDLVAAYEAMNEPARAQRFRDELLAAGVRAGAAGTTDNAP